MIEVPPIRRMTSPLGGLTGRSVPVLPDYRARLLSMRLLRALFGTLGRLAPRSCGRLAFELFHAPIARRRPARDLRVLEHARRLAVLFRGGRLTAFDWGRGPRVLLVHG